MGGDVQCINVSAKNKEGLDNLIEALELQSELMELKSDHSLIPLIQIVTLEPL